MKIYVDRASGERVQILKEETGFYVLSNNVSIKKDAFIKKYDEAINPDEFLQSKASTDPMLNLAQQIKNYDTANIREIGRAHV